MKSGLNNEREYHKIRDVISMQKICMEKALIRFKLKNDLIKKDSKSLSIFKEKTTDTVFMGNIIFYVIKIKLKY